MSIENPQFEWSSISPEDQPRTTVETARVTPDKCIGHFKDGPKIMPAFRALGLLSRKIADEGYLPHSMHLQVAGMIPEGVKYTATHTSADNIYQMHTLMLSVEPKGRIVVTGDEGEGYFIDELRTATNQSTPIDPEKILLDSRAVAETIPQGEEIRFIDAVIKPDDSDGSHSTILTALHRVTADDYYHNDRGYYFGYDRLLEGFGQLAYLHFVQSSKLESLPIPFFKEVHMTINPQQRPPLIGDNIEYQLTGFSSDFATRGNRGHGFITGRVITRQNQSEIATFTATVGAISPKLLESAVKNITALARKAEESPIQPNEQA